MLKGVIFGVEDVLITNTGGQAQAAEIIRLFKYLKSNNIQPVVLANRDWTVGTPAEAIDKLFDRIIYKFPWFIADRPGSGVPKKPSKDASRHVLNKMGWSDREVLYVGNDDADMMTAANGGLLFLSSQWYAKQKYGITFDTPKDIARFIDVFCIRDYLWHYELVGQEAEFYSLGTYGFLEDKYKLISQDAKEAAKFGRGHPDFWIRYLLSTVYFSGLSFNYIATFPSSQKGITPSIMPETVHAFANCFHKKYLPDLIFRHSASLKSTSTRNSGGDVDHFNQLNTINLEKLPMFKQGKRYKASPLTSGKTVLVIDDFCTSGYAQEAARLFIKQTGARAIGLSLLKTISKGYREITSITPSQFDPYTAAKFSDLKFIPHAYGDGVKDATHGEIEKKLLRYDTWDWPRGV